MALCFQGKSCSCREWNVRRWLCATKTNNDFVADRMLEGGFVIPGKYCFSYMLNVGKLPCGTKTNHVVAVN